MNDYKTNTQQEPSTQAAFIFLHIFIKNASQRP